ncbi:MAG: glycosyltransferase family 2 protein [Acidimicrobiales bacterium]
MGERSGLTATVIIAAYTVDRCEQTSRSIDSVLHQTCPPVEVILCIDSNPELFARAADHWATHADGHPPVRVLQSNYDHDPAELESHARAHGAPRRFGAGVARTFAASRASGDVLLFLDDDAWAEPDWVERILATYTGDEVLAVGGAPVPDYEASRPDWMPPEFDWTFGCVYRGLPETIGPTIRLIGANMSVRSEVLDRIGGFRSIDFDDMDMCHRVAALGGPGSIIFNPAAVVHHYVPHGRTTWHYFWRRCYHVNRNKVRALQETGVPHSVAPDLRFVLATATTGLIRELLGAIRGRRAALRRGAAIVVGVASAGIGSIVGHIDMRRHRGGAGVPAARS